MVRVAVLLLHAHVLLERYCAGIIVAVADIKRQPEVAACGYRFEVRERRAVEGNAAPYGTRLRGSYNRAMVQLVWHRTPPAASAFADFNADLPKGRTTVA